MMIRAKSCSLTMHETNSGCFEYHSYWESGKRKRRSKMTSFLILLLLLTKDAACRGSLNKVEFRNVTDCEKIASLLSSH